MKYIFAFIFSDLGVMVLAIAVAYFGALMYISIELPGKFSIVENSGMFYCLSVKYFVAVMYTSIELPGKQ